MQIVDGVPAVKPFLAAHSPQTSATPLAFEVVQNQSRSAAVGVHMVGVVGVVGVPTDLTWQ